MIFFVFVTCESCFNWGIAQNSTFYPTPWIQEIELPDQYVDIPNKSFFLDHLGHLFLGKENVLTILNENKSVHIQMNGPVFVTGQGSDTLFYACKNDIGLLIKEKDGLFQTQSYKDRILRAYRDFSPTQLIYADHSVFLNSEKGIYQFKNGRIKVFPYQESYTSLHVIEGELFLRIAGHGFREWSGTGFDDLTAGSQAYDPTLLPDILESSQGYTFLDFLSWDELLVVSPGEGIQVLNCQGKVIRVLGIREGMPDRDILQASTCEGDELWILGVHTLHKINQPSSLNIIYFDPGSIGRILASAVTDHGIVLGTSHGVFVAETREDLYGQWEIQCVSGETPGAYQLIEKAGHTVFGAGSGHLLSVRDNRSDLLAAGNFTGMAAMRDDLLIASGEEGVIRYDLSDDGWTSTLLDPSLTCSHSFARYGGSVFFICNNQAYRLSDDLESVIPLPFHREEMLFRLIPMDRELYLITDNQVYRYETGEETFLPLDKDNKAKILTVSDIIIPDASEGYWMVRHQGKYMSGVRHAKASAAFEEDQRSYPVLQNLGEIINLNIRDSILFLTGPDKVSLFDLSLLDTDDSRLPIRVEPLGNFSKLTSAGFHLAGLEFQSTPEPEFRYKLLPAQEAWSEWNNNREIFYDRLKPGHYRLIAQAKDLYGRYSEPSEFQFVIEAPFYRTWYAYVVYGLIFLIFLFLIQKWRLLGNQRAESRVSQRMQTKLDDLTVEKEKSDKLVAEILPDRTAAQLKSEGKAKWDKYERATVLFSDIQGFTKIAEEMNPEVLIDELDKFFFHFDSVVEKYNIEKIKTIGDAYMAAGGIPTKNSTNPVEVVLAALEMQIYMQQLKSTKTDIWDLRIGIHTGPVIAGVVGHKKMSYDIWGDTVNTASRMESSGIPGKVNISGITYGMVKEYFICEYRGKLPVKYKGNIDMYFVNGLRPELSVDLKGIPNKRFFTKLQLLRLGDLEEKVFETILINLPSNLYFHKIEFAKKIYNQSFLLSRAEEIEQDERLLVRTAALLLYTGLTQAYFNYENRSSVIAREILPEFKYSETQIDQICNLIMATKQPFHPNNQLEKILIDAKMEYLGRPDYHSQIKLMFMEMKEAGSNINGQQFKKQQLELLYGFDYFTISGRRLREVPGQEQRNTLEQERWI
ncbi:MAG: adenylate/guanylate cyclase domain-containing protein [Bacteroidota bacterium]